MVVDSLTAQPTPKPMPLNGRWVCDGLIQSPVSLGPGYKRSYTASYTALRKAGAFSAGLAA